MLRTGLFICEPRKQFVGLGIDIKIVKPLEPIPLLRRLRVGDIQFARTLDAPALAFIQRPGTQRVPDLGSELSADVHFLSLLLLPI